MSRLRTNTSTSTMHATPTNNHITWPTARLGARLVTNAMPIPDSANERGSRAGSALAANLRTARCAMTKATKMAAGTPRVVMSSDCPWLMAIMANSSATTGAATSSRTSSTLWRVTRHRRS